MDNVLYVDFKYAKLLNAFRAEIVSGLLNS